MVYEIGQLTATGYEAIANITAKQALIAHMASNGFKVINVTGGIGLTRKSEVYVIIPASERLETPNFAHKRYSEFASFDKPVLVKLGE